jgi:hypothetical protein
MEVLKGIHVSFCFWVGVRDPTKRKVLQYTSQNPSTDALAVFQPPAGEFSSSVDGMNLCFPTPHPTPTLLRLFSLLRFLFYKWSFPPAYLRAVLMK